MALVLKDRVKETTSSTGTGVITLLGAVQGYQAFSSIGNGNTTYYCIQTTSDWEVGIGVVGSNTLTRNNVLASSNGGNLVSFGTGVKDVFCTYPAARSVSTDSLPVTTAFETSSPNNTVNVASLTSAVTSTDGDIALVPKGSGAILAQVPTGTIAGGNKRGLYAVDWQTYRSASTQVASGLLSGIGSGSFNTASGALSYIGGGGSNTASGGSAVVVGGGDNLASGDYSFIGGGNFGTTRGISGFHAFPACVQPLGSTAGASQAGMLIVAGQTTNATPKVLVSTDSLAADATNQFVIPNNSAALLNVAIVGWDKTDYYTVDTTNSLLTRGASAASTVYQAGYYQFAPSSGASTWSVAFAADTTNGGLRITVTGQAGKTIRWVARILSTEVRF